MSEELYKILELFLIYQSFSIHCCLRYQYSSKIVIIFKVHNLTNLFCLKLIFISCWLQMNGNSVIVLHLSKVVLKTS